MKKVYYAHSMHLYNTLQEKKDIDFLESLGYEVVNPNCKVFERQYRSWLIENNIQDKDKMKWFESIVKPCDVLAYRSHTNLRIPSGVLYEIDYAFRNGILVFEIPTIIESRRMTLKETRQYLRDVGYKR